MFLSAYKSKCYHHIKKLLKLEDSKLRSKYALRTSATFPYTVTRNPILIGKDIKSMEISWELVNAML